MNTSRRNLIIEATARHMTNEQENGQKRAVETAVAEMIGASRYLQTTLGEERARSVVAALYDSL